MSYWHVCVMGGDEDKQLHSILVLYSVFVTLYPKVQTPNTRQKYSNQNLNLQNFPNKQDNTINTVFLSDLGERYF